MKIIFSHDGVRIVSGLGTIQGSTLLHYLVAKLLFDQAEDGASIQGVFGDSKSGKRIIAFNIIDEAGKIDLAGLDLEAELE